MRFTSWLWNQVDDLGDQAGFARVAWNDVNNGCASAAFSASDWIRHFDEKHYDNRSDLTYQLFVSFQEYKKALAAK
jgi:hypothetical protein